MADRLEVIGYQFVPAADMHELLARTGDLGDWSAFTASWNDLGPDTYMADHGRYRRRRHAVFAGTAEAMVRQPAQPHYQSRDYNPLNGGIERWFEPITESVGAGASLTTILSFCRSLFGAVSPVCAWHVEVHQFRIEAWANQAGSPTPEGVHRDGVDYVMVLLINRTNIISGVTSVHDLVGNKLGEFTLTQPFDAALVNDTRVMHGVTPVEPLDRNKRGHRDVLVVTFRPT